MSGDGAGGPGRATVGRGLLLKQALLQANRSRGLAEEKEAASGSGAMGGLGPVAQPSASVPKPAIGRAGLLLQQAILQKQMQEARISQEPTAYATGPATPSAGRAAMLLQSMHAAKGVSVPQPVPAVSSPPKEPQTMPSVKQKTQLQPPPQGMGTTGARVELTANYIPLQLKSGCHVYEYAVLYDPVIDSLHFRYKLIGQLSEDLGLVRVFDGAKLYIPKLLPDQITTLKGNHPGDESAVKVIVKFVTERDLKDCTHLFNVLFKRVMRTLSLTEVGRHSYDPKSSIAIPQHKLEIWPGFITAINVYKGGLMLQADVSHRVLRMQTVLDMMVETHSTSGSNFYDVLKKKLTGLIVLTRYNNATYKIDDINWDMSPKSTFKTSQGKELTFLEYYKTHYNLTINDVNQPLLIHHTKPRKKSGFPGEKTESQLVCLVPELSYLTGLSEDIRSDFRVMKDLSAHTRVNPTERQYCLRKFIQNVNSNTEAQAILGAWGLYFENDTIRLDGRVTKSEKITMRNNTFQVNEEADWSRDAMRSQVLKSVDLKNWEIVFCGRDEGKADDFVKLMGGLCPSLGMMVDRPNKTRLRDERIETLVQCLREILNRKEVQLVTIINPSMRTDRYSAIKKLCCCDMPVPSQVINSRTLNNPAKNRSIVAKIALQINCKLGGELWGVEIPLKSLMVCGFDAYHDPHRGNLSVLGFVASINAQVTRWYNHTCIQTKGQEVADSLRLCLSSALCKYYEVNHTLPEKIIIYRDGVSDGQMNMVLEHEVPQLERAFEAYQNYKPSLTVIVVQKRINTRLLAVIPGRSGQFSNPPPGTVVDHTITKKDIYDFYLVSQFARQGTVFPTHYTVLHNTSNLTPDHIQRLSYKMTHLYYNWPGTIRVPAACQYAHRLAYLVGENIRQVPNVKLQDRLFFL